MMSFSKRKSSWVPLIVCGAVALTGCQTIRDSNARSEEEMLAAAGFQMKQALTPEQLANVQSMPQRKLVPHTKDGRVLYVYADAEACRCAYAGTEKNYQDYQKMAYQKELADEQETTAEMNSEARFDWEVWGPWGPWGY
ncbi:MAG: hypothetical protein ABH891_08945 [Candidatus Omnitrophota bacterium]